jgi:hypothetical protein
MGAFFTRIKDEINLEKADWDDFDKGLWIEVFGSSSIRCCRSNPIIYLIFVLLSALCMTTVWVWSWLDGCGPIWFAFLTHWSLTIQTIYTWVDLFTTTMASGMKSGRIEPVNRMPFYAKATWFLYDLLLPTTFLVFVLYFALVVDWDDPPTKVLPYLTHGLNFVVMISDSVLSLKPYYLIHGLYFGAFAVIYVLFTYVYYLLGGKDCDGNPYLYEVLQWGDNFDGAKTISGIILFIVVPVVNFAFWVVVSFWFPGLRPTPDTPVAEE